MAAPVLEKMARGAGLPSKLVVTSRIPHPQPSRQTAPARRRRNASRHWLAVLSLVLAACGSQTDGIEISPQNLELVAAGAEFYVTHCAECHGPDLRGTDKGPSHLSIVYEPNHHADGAFLFAVQRGSPAHHWSFGDMPPIEGLSADDIDAIVAFVRETQRLEGFEPYP